MDSLFAEPDQRPAIVELSPGAFHITAVLTMAEQRALVDECRALADGPVPAYVPTARGGGRMHVRMLCLGRHWNATTYTYEPARSDFDGQAARRCRRGFVRWRDAVPGWPG